MVLGPVFFGFGQEGGAVNPSAMLIQICGPRVQSSAWFQLPGLHDESLSPG